MAIFPDNWTATSHSNDELTDIQERLKAFGVEDYRFLLCNDAYICDKEGKFFSVCHRQTSKAGRPIKHIRIVPLNGSVDRCGYVTYRAVVDGHKKHIKGHRELLAAWSGGYSHLVVNHKDGDKKNNSLSNLEWCTVSENNSHAIRTGLFDPRKQKRRLKIPLCDWVSIALLRNELGLSFEKIGGMFNASRETVRQVYLKIEGYIQRVKERFNYEEAKVSA